MLSLALLTTQPLLPLITLPILCYGGVISGAIAQIMALSYVWVLILRQMEHRQTRIGMILGAQLAWMGYVWLQ